MNNFKFKIGDIIYCIDNTSARNLNSPPIKIGAKYIVQNIMNCDNGCCELVDIGVYCDLVVTKCGCDLGKGTWWMNVSRFQSELDIVLTNINNEISK